MTPKRLESRHTDSQVKTASLTHAPASRQVHHQTSEISWCAVSHIESFLVRLPAVKPIAVAFCVSHVSDVRGTRPDAPAQWGAHMHRLPASTQRRSALFLTRVYQKIAFVRGRGRTLCTKSHLLGLLPALREMHPTARFVTIVRPVEGVFPSFWSLQRAISRDFSYVETGGPEYAAMRVAFLREMHAELRRAFGDGTAPGARVLTFQNFIADPPAEVARLYDGWGLSYDRQRLTERVTAYLGAEEHVHPFPNASWEEMGIKREARPFWPACRSLPTPMRR